MRLLTVSGDIIPPARFPVLKVLPTEDQLFKYMSMGIIFFLINLQHCSHDFYIIQNAANLISKVPIVITILKFKVPSKTQCNPLCPPVNQKTSYMLPPYKGTEYPFPFQKEGLVGIVRKY